LFVDDHSSDSTANEISSLIKLYGKKVKFYTKQGKRGKAFSIIEGVTYANFDTICMIDADLQYAPEYIAPMYTLMNSSGKDIVITKRTINETSILRKILSSGFNLVFTRLMFGINYDTQSGLKLFKAKVFEKVEINPSPWGFDLEFIVLSLMNGFTVTSMDINFSERTNGDAKVNVLKTSLELAKESIKLRSKISKKSLKTFYVKNLEVA
jgi:glycosyltransferase involved in cell wall biosynthesis